jgi:ribosome-binding factor A
MGLRQERLADEIRDVVATCFIGGQMNDPRLDNVTITAVKVTADLQLASVYYRVMTDSVPKDQVQKGLQHASGYLRNRIADAIEMRRVPSLRFFFDESIERGSRIEYLLANLNHPN